MLKVKLRVRTQKWDSSRLEYRRVQVLSLFFDHVFFSIFRPHGSACACFKLKECQLAFTERRTYSRYIYIYIIYEKSTVQLTSVGLTQARPN